MPGGPLGGQGVAPGIGADEDERLDLRPGGALPGDTRVDGAVEAAAQAFVDLRQGADTGKMLVRF